MAAICMSGARAATYHHEVMYLAGNRISPSILFAALALLALFAAKTAAMSTHVNVRLHVLRYADLPGWRNADHVAALAAFKRSCQAIRSARRKERARFAGPRHLWLRVCAEADRTQENQRAARHFFERHFLPVSPTIARRAAGLFTGYYEPEVEGSLTRKGPFVHPLLARPDDLLRFTPGQARIAGTPFGRIVKGRPVPYFTRQEIEQGALSGRGLEIVWLKSLADAFFVQIQGSARVRLVEGGVMRLSFAGKTGQPYTPIGRLLVERGEIPREKMSMQAIRHWLATHPEKAQALLWENKSYVFFRRVDLPDPRLGAYGAQGVQLAPWVSLAVDNRFWPYGAPVWLDTRIPGPNDSDEREDHPFRRLMIAQDTGSAIRGVIRGDIYFGFGEKAGALAGRMNAPGFMAVLLPRLYALRLARP